MISPTAAAPEPPPEPPTAEQMPRLLGGSPAGPETAGPSKVEADKDALARRTEGEGRVFQRAAALGEEGCPADKWERVDGLVSELFPFRFLRQGHQESTRLSFGWQLPTELRCPGRRRKLRTSETYLLIFLGWGVAATAFAYPLLAMGSGLREKDPERLYPKVGSNMHAVVLGKLVALIALFHILCRRTMVPMHDMAHHRSSHTELNTPGLFMFIRNCRDRVLGRAGREHWWFSTFLTDHILLLLVGAGFSCFQILLLIFRIRDNPSDIFLNALVALLSVYVGILVQGFLITTLENNAVPKTGKEKEFMALLLICEVLWLSEFLSLFGERKQYLAYPPMLGGLAGRLQNAIISRVLATTAQLFVTHSCIMLGAVLFGHTCHFTKCPDLQWGTIVYKAAPCFIFCVLDIKLLASYTQVPWGPTCGDFLYKFAEQYPHVLYDVKIAGGTALLLAALWVGQEHEPNTEPEQEAAPAEAAMERGDGAHGGHVDELGHEAGEMDLQRHLSDLFEYDTVLVLLTFSGALWWNVLSVFVASAMKAWVTFAAELSSAVAPVGLALFVLVAWRRPRARGTLQSRLHWPALLLACVCFNDFQHKEDCEVSSPMPGCCGFPGLSDWSATKEAMCNLGARCQNAFRPHGDSEELFCFLEQKPKAQKELNSTIPEKARKLAAAEPGPQPTCATLHTRWEAYAKTDFLKLEVEEEAAKYSTAYTVFKMFGKAASVEFYFTLIGLLMKLIVRAEHPHSQAILDLKEHHGCSKAGHLQVVEVRRTPLASSLVEAAASSVRRARWQWAVATALHGRGAAGATGDPAGPAPAAGPGAGADATCSTRA